jgi:hypothetical protein
MQLFGSFQLSGMMRDWRSGGNAKKVAPKSLLAAKAGGGYGQTV